MIETLEASYRQHYQASSAAEKYDREIYGPASHDSILWESEKSVLLRLLERTCPNHASAQALDFACGSGRILCFLRPLVRSLVGVDVSRAMLDVAASKVSDTQLICADILASSDEIPGDRDIISAFRFLLLAEPPLRVNCVRALVSKLKKDGILIMNTHGNPVSVRFLASLRNRWFRPETPPLPSFSLADMRELGEVCDLRIIAAGGVGFLPRSLTKRLPLGMVIGTERILSRLPLLWRLATNIIVVMKRK